MQKQVARHRRAGHVKDHGLEGASPHHRLDAAEAYEHHADRREEGQRIAKLPAHDDRHGQRGSVQPHAGGEKAGHEEESRAGVLGFGAEAVLQEFIDGRAVELVESRDENEGDQHAGRGRADKELQVLQVLGEADRRDPDYGHRAYLGGHEREGTYPDRGLAAAQEIVLGIFLPPAFEIRYREESDDGDAEQPVVQRGQTGNLLKSGCFVHNDPSIFTGILPPALMFPKSARAAACWNSGREQKAQSPAVGPSPASTKGLPKARTTEPAAPAIAASSAALSPAARFMLPLPARGFEKQPAASFIPQPGW